MEFSNPKEISGKVLDFAGFVIFGELLLVIIEAGGQTALGVFMHFFGADLEFNDTFIFSNDGSVERLVTILLRHSDVIFNAARHWHIERVDDAKGKIAIGDVADDDAESD